MNEKNRTKFFNLLLHQILLHGIANHCYMTTYYRFHDYILIVSDNNKYMSIYNVARTSETIFDNSLTINTETGYVF